MEQEKQTQRQYTQEPKAEAIKRRVFGKEE